MRNFSKAIAASLAFCLCVCLFAEAIVWPYFHETHFFYQDAAVRDALAGSVDTLFSGASHGSSGFDTKVMDEVLGVNSYNISGNLMSMEGRRTLLEKELARNPVKTVIFELSFNTLTRDRKTEGAEGDIYILGRMNGLGERLSFFTRAFYDSEYLRVAGDTLSRGEYAWRARYMGIASKVDAAAKGFCAQVAADQSMSSEQFAQLHHTASVSEDTKQQNLDAFWSMVEECQARGISVIFVTTPLSDRALAQYDNFEQIHQWYLYYAQQYGCPLLDFNLYRGRDALLPDDTAFFDTFHLSAEGAAAFTRELARLVGKLNAGEDFSDEFYSSYAEVDALLCSTYKQA